MNNVNEVLGKYITRTTNERFLVQVYKDRKQQYVGTFPTREEAVIGRDAYPGMGPK